MQTEKDAVAVVALGSVDDRDPKRSLHRGEIRPHGTFPLFPSEIVSNACGQEDV